jgi:formate hydrogenlyase subunit 6/NADH:ubiquinone oxidoreductase subunit I
VRPLALFGLAAADLRGIAFLDRFFSTPPADDVYQRLRRGALLIGLSGACGVEGSFMPLAAGDCDFELIARGEGWLGWAHTPRGQEWLQKFPAGDEALLDALQRKSAQQGAERRQLLQRAAALLEQERVPEEFWGEIAARCILCSGCNLVCPTCNCFCVEDQVRGAAVERRRVWDSCQLDAFMREASGHNPLGTEALRTRRRIFHKLVADPQRWGEFGCVACGRCDAACPTGIGLFAICEELLARYSS